MATCARMATASGGRRTAGEWSKLVTKWKRSGQSASVFGEREGVSARSLYWWRWKLRQDEAQGGLGLIPVTVVDDPEEGAALRTRWAIRLPDGTGRPDQVPPMVAGRVAYSE